MKHPVRSAVILACSALLAMTPLTGHALATADRAQSMASSAGLTQLATARSQPPAVSGGESQQTHRIGPLAVVIAILGHLAVEAVLEVVTAEELQEPDFDTRTIQMKAALLHRIPKPDPETIRRTGDYRLYQILYGSIIRPRQHVWKYGITGVGDSRPQRQLRSCAASSGRECVWEWVRNRRGHEIRASNYYRIRQAEYAFTLAWASRHDGVCPPGQIVV